MEEVEKIVGKLEYWPTKTDFVREAVLERLESYRKQIEDKKTTEGKAGRIIVTKEAKRTEHGSRILVTGGAGFIGSHLVDDLLQNGFEVNVLDNLSTGTLANLSGHADSRKFQFLNGELRDGTALGDALDDVEAVFHLAAITSVPYSVENPEVTHEVNVAGTRKLLEACLRVDVKRFIYISTCAVYGDPEYLPVDEKHPTKPMSPYGESKLKAEQLCGEFSKDYGLRITVLRPFNVYGLRQRNDQYSGVIFKFIERLGEGKPPVIYGDGSQTRDFINVKDAVEAFLMALHSETAVGRTFNIATGVPTSVNQLAQLLIELLGAEGIKPEYASAGEGDIKHSYGDIKEARNYLGFNPRTQLKEGLCTLLGKQSF